MSTAKNKVYAAAEPLTDDDDDDYHGPPRNDGPRNIPFVRNEVQPFSMQEAEENDQVMLAKKPQNAAAAAATTTIPASPAKPTERIPLDRQISSTTSSEEVVDETQQTTYAKLVASEFPSANKSPEVQSIDQPKATDSVTKTVSQTNLVKATASVKSMAAQVAGKDGKQGSKKSMALSMRETVPHLTPDDIEASKHAGSNAVSINSSRSNRKQSVTSATPAARKSTGVLLHLFHYQTTQKQLKHFRERVTEKIDQNAGTAADKTVQRNSSIVGRRLSRIQILRNRASSMELPNKTREDLTSAQAWRQLIILPTSHFWVVWNSLHLLVLGYLCAVAPYVAVLRTPERPYSWTEPISRVIDCFYVSDIIANFRAAFIDFQTGELVYDFKSIASAYLSGWFWFDAFMSLPLDAIIPEDSFNKSKLPFALRLLRLIRLAKLIRILKANYLADFFEDHFGFNRNRLVMLELIVTIFIVAHFTACGFILVASMGGDGFDDPTSWVFMNHLNDSPPREIYVAALYWTFTMMTTVGFGDIVPCNFNERIYAVCGMVISAGTYAYVIASISSMVSLLNLSSTRYYEKLNELNAYMESRKLPMALQLKTRRFFRFYLSKKTAFDETTIFAGLSTNLRTELVEHYIKTVIRQNAFFHDIEKGFTSMIALVLKPAFFPPKSDIIQQGDIADEMFIVTRGTLEVFLEVITPPSNAMESRPLGNLNTGDHFGEMALLCDPNNLHRFATVKTRTHCELHSLDYGNLKKGINKYPLVKRKLMATAKVRLILLNNLKKAKMGNMFKSAGRSARGDDAIASTRSIIQRSLFRSGATKRQVDSNRGRSGRDERRGGGDGGNEGAKADKTNMAQVVASAASQFVKFRKRKLNSENASGKSTEHSIKSMQRSGKSALERSQDSTE